MDNSFINFTSRAQGIYWLASELLSFELNLLFVVPDLGEYRAYSDLFSS